ncbi:Tim44 domain-containing protein [Spartinivicinus ruber]|uniref:Tim44 domain-containing protein n=1 Tax=Spartinivicinus ruber TaxID=2683272 RepID=UPI0013D1FB61|nr:Tim44-like domain-containing protein [Spartinivicinus ruber]
MKHRIVKLLTILTLSSTAALNSYASANANITHTDGFQPFTGGLLTSLLLKTPFHNLRVADILVLTLLTVGLAFLLKYRSDQLKRYLKARPEPVIDDEALASLSTSIQQDITTTTESTAPEPVNDRTIPFHLGFKNKTITTSTPQVNSKTPEEAAKTNTSTVDQTSDLAAHYAQFDLPEGLQPELFLEQAKELFKRVHLAWLAGDQQTLKHYTTPELFERLSLSLPSQTEQTTIDLLTVFADITSARNLGELAMITVKFHGWSKPKASKEVEAYSEVWHLENQQQDNSQWLITGIQPVSGNLKINSDSNLPAITNPEA